MMKFAILTSAFFAGICFECLAAEPLRNPSFESGDFSGWDTKGKGWSISDQSASDGLLAALCSVKKGDARGVRVCMQQIGPVEQGKIVELTLDVAATDIADAPNSKASVAVLCLGADGSVRKEYRSSIVRPSRNFKQVKIDDAVVLPGTVGIYVMFVVEVYQPAGDDDWWRFDNVKVRIQ